MVRELIADIDPAHLASPYPIVPVWRRKRGWLTVGWVGFAILVALGYWFELPHLNSFITWAPVWFLVAWCAYGALSGQVGDETMRWQTSALFTVVTIAVAYGLYFSRQQHGQEPALDPPSLMIAVVAGFLVANGYAEIAKRDRRETWLNAVVRKIRDAHADTFEPAAMFQTPTGVVWTIDPAHRALRAFVAGPVEHVRSIIWDEPIRSVVFRRLPRRVWFSREHPFDSELVVRSGKDTVSEWTYTFQFPGQYRDAADRWHGIFESWMIKDRESIHA